LASTTVSNVDRQIKRYKITELEVSSHGGICHIGNKMTSDASSPLRYIISSNCRGILYPVQSYDELILDVDVVENSIAPRSPLGDLVGPRVLPGGYPVASVHLGRVVPDGRI
jgi:hypothetical protein